MDDSKRNSRVALAAVVAAHGTGGAVRLKLFASLSTALSAKARIMVGDDMLTLRSIKATAQGAIAAFDNITNRNQAEALRGAVLSIPREQLPPLADGEYYHHDLIGLACVTTDKLPIGNVVAVQNFGAGDILEIECPSEPSPEKTPEPTDESNAEKPSGAKRKPAKRKPRKPKRVLVPMSKIAVPHWDSQTVYINPDFVV